MKDLNVAYILLRFPYLTETFIAGEVQELRKQGVKVHIFSLLSPKKEVVHPIAAELVPHTHYVPEIYVPSIWWAQLYFLLKAPGQYIKLLWSLMIQPTPKLSFLLRRLTIFLKGIWLAKELQNSPVQMIHTHFAWLSAAAGMIVSRLLDLPFSITTHAYDIYSQSNDLFKLTTLMADRLITISEYNKQAMLEQNKTLSVEKINVIHCGINLNEFQAITKSTADDFKIISVGSLLEKKGHEYLIRACSELATQGVNFKCMIVGGGDLEQPLQTLIQDLNLTDKVVLTGPQTQTWVRNELSQSDLFALACVVSDAGDRDGIPVAMMEALAMEVPVVTTSVSGIPELVNHEATGLLAPQKDAKALAAAIDQLIKNKPLRQTLGKNGRVLVESEYNISKNAAQLTDLFRQAIAERGK